MDVIVWTTAPLPPPRVDGGTEESGALRRRTPYLEWNLQKKIVRTLAQKRSSFLLNCEDDLIKPTRLHMMNNDNSEEGSGGAAAATHSTARKKPTTRSGRNATS